MDSRGILWTLVESCPLTIEVGFRLGSSCDDEVLESDDEIEFL